MRVILSVLFSFLLLSSFAQTFTSVIDGNWNDGATWGNASPGVEGTDFPGAGSTVIIATTHSITIPNGYNAQAANISFIVPDNFTDLTIASGGSLTFTGTITLGIGPISRGRLFVDGRLTVPQGATIVNSASVGRITVGSTGIYEHNYSTTAGTIYTAEWVFGSTLQITGYTTNSSIPLGLNQSFSNFTWNCPGQQVDFYLSGTELTTIGGNLSVLSTGGGFIFGLTTENDLILEVGGDLILGTGNPGDDVYFDLSGGSANSANTILNLNGDLYINNADALANFGSGTCQVVFNDDSSPPQNLFSEYQMFSSVDYLVSSGATLVIGQNNFLSSTGEFQLDGSVLLGSTHPTSAIIGNIQTSTRVFSDGSTIEYNGSAGQFMNSAHPSGANINTIINNSSPAGVNLASNVVIGGDLTLTTGNLLVGTRTLTLRGNVTGTGRIVVSPSSSIVVTGGEDYTFPFPSGTQTFSNFTLNSPSGSVTFANNVTLSGLLTLTDGILNINGITLTLNGTFSSGAGQFGSTSTTSALVINGSGAFGTISFDPAANTIGSLTMNRASGTAELNSNLVVNNALNLTSGTFTNTSGLTLANNAVVTRNSAGQLNGIPISNNNGDRYSVSYTGAVAFNSGLELPSDAVDLLNLTIGAPVTLDKPITVNGTLTLQSSTLTSGGFDITMAGNPGVWNKVNGSYSSGAATVFISGNVSIQSSSSPAQFGNLEVSSGANLTFPSSTLNISGNLLIAAGSAISHNNGTILFSSGGSQSLGGGGKTLNNITVNKTGGTLIVTSPTSVAGLFNILSATTVASNNDLTLLSTSDGPSGTASIGELPTGASITGNVTVQRYMSKEGNIYRYISSPVAKLPVSQLQDDFPVIGPFTGTSTCTNCSTNPSMYWWDEPTSSYIAFPVSSNADTLMIGRGYAAFVRHNLYPGPIVLDFTGVLYQGPVSIPLSFTGGGSDFNLVGNPYASTITWEEIPNRPNVANVIAIRDNGSGGTFQYWDGTEQSSGLTDGRIAAGQAFWARATAASAAINLTESAKSSTNGTFYRKSDEEVNVFKVILAKGNVIDRAVLRLREDATVELDDNDAPKLNNEGFDISTVTPGGISMAINATNEMVCDAINLKIADMAQGTYTMSVETFGIFLNTGATLVDNFTNTQHDFKTSPQYQFSVTSNAASSVANRFSILLDQPDINPSAISTSLADAACNGDQYQVQLDNAQAGVYYFAELDGQVLGDSVLSNGSDPVLLNIAASRLAVGSNSVVLKGYNYCETLPLTNAVEIKHDKLYAASATNASRCLEGIVDLEAQGAPLDGLYNWYEAEDSATPIAGQHGNIFTTPSLVKTSSYFVSVVNSLGCEGTRTPVVAEVKHYDDVTISENSPGSLTSSYDEGNQWYFNDTPIEGATGQSYSPEESGSYRVDVTTQGCVTSAAMEFVVTGVESTNPKSGISVYPTPTKDILYVRSAPGVKVNGISIFDNLGAKVGDLTLTETEKGKEGTFDMSHSADGIYFVKALVDQRTITIKVVKK